MAEDERGTDRDDASQDGGAPPGLPYDPAVLAAKLAAAREQRRQVLAARAAAEGEKTPEERRAKVPPFARRPDRTPPAPEAGAMGGDVIGTSPPPSPAEPPVPPEVEAEVEPARPEGTAALPATWEPATTAAFGSRDEEPSARPRAVPGPGADRATASAAAGGPGRALVPTTPRRRRPVTAAAPRSPTLTLAEVSPRRTRPRSLSIALAVTALGCALVALLFLSPPAVRQRVADAIAPAPAPEAATTPSVVATTPPPAAVHNGDSNPPLVVELAPSEPDEPAPSGAPSAAGTERTASAATDTAAAPSPAVAGAAEPTTPPTEEGAAPPVQAAAEPSPPRSGAGAPAIVPPLSGASIEAGEDEAAGPEPTTAWGPAAEATRVVLHFPASAVREARRVEATLRAAGLVEVATVPAGFSISRTNVRYYRPEYRDVGRAVADLAIAPLDGAPVDIRDFTAFRPRPSPGTIEVWLAGTNDEPAPTVRTAASDAAAGAAPDRAAERERLEDEITRLLRARLREL